MIFRGISRSFCTENGRQYKEIEAFWDEMAGRYGLEKLRGLGWKWTDRTIQYAIGLKDGDIHGWDTEILVPDDGWRKVVGRSDELNEIYETIYAGGRIMWETEKFFEDDTCVIEYVRGVEHG